jgi:CheY-like chemotaxis protein
MIPRELIFEDSKTIRKTLNHFPENLGYEVFTFSDPGMCPINNSSDHICPLDHDCSDIIISDVNMSTESGLEFIKNRVQKGCKIRCRALMSADWADPELKFAQELGCKIFHKAFDMQKMLLGLDDCRNRLDPDRKLIGWPPYIQQ